MEKPINIIIEYTNLIYLKKNLYGTTQRYNSFKRRTRKSLTCMR